MSHRSLASAGMLAVIVVVSVTPGPVADPTSLGSFVGVAEAAGEGAQAPTTAAPTGAAANTWNAPRTPWGDPDLQGLWTNTTTTPLERPKDLGEKQVLTDEELADLDAQVAERVSFDNIPRTSVGGYNEFWVERGKLFKQTSLIVDPPDGRLPLTPEAQTKQVARAEYSRAHPADSWEDVGLFTRCITRGLPSAMVPGFYNHNYHILQTPGYVVILVEMIHEARIIPLDGRPHVGQHIRQWLGDSRGRWEGNTLLVETTNFTSKTNFRGSSENMRLVERFTRVDAETIDYQFTVDDATTFTGPWTAAIPMTKLQGMIFEYACHEGNYGIVNILSGHRAQEKAEAAKTQSR